MKEKQKNNKTKPIKKGKKCEAKKVDMKKTPKGTKEYFQCDKCLKWNLLPEKYTKKLEEIEEM